MKTLSDNDQKPKNINKVVQADESVEGELLFRSINLASTNR